MLKDVVNYHLVSLHQQVVINMIVTMIVINKAIMVLNKVMVMTLKNIVTDINYKVNKI